MFISPDIWKSLAGIAIFLLGMNFLEEGPRHLAGRPFKLFLKKQTSNKLKAITGGPLLLLTEKETDYFDELPGFIR